MYVKELVNLLILVVLRTSNDNLKKKGSNEPQFIENVLL